MNAAGKGHPHGKRGAGADDLRFSPGACRLGKGLLPPCPNTEHTRLKNSRNCEGNSEKKGQVTA
eukprot:6492715-Amphidinium_carterae.1